MNPLRILLITLVVCASFAAFGQVNPLARHVAYGEGCSLEEPQPVSPINAWGATEVGSSPAGFYRDATCVVHLQGLMWKFHTGEVSEFIFVLPPGYRPRQPEFFLVNMSGRPATLLVYATGEVQIITELNFFGWVSLSGVTFRSQ